MVSIANTTSGTDNALVGCPTSPLPSTSASKDPITPELFLMSLNPRRSPIVQVKIRSDDDDVVKYQEIRITGFIYCDHNSHHSDVATSIEAEEQQMAIINDSEFGFLCSAGVVYACDVDCVEVISLSSNDAMLDPSDLDFFEDDEEVSSFESQKEVMNFEDATAESFADFKAVPGLSTGISHDEGYDTRCSGLPILPMLGFGRHTEDYSSA